MGVEEIRLPFAGPRGRREWEVLVRPGIPVTLDLDGGASAYILDLSGLRVVSFDLSTGATSVELTAPASAGHVDGTIQGGAASYQVTIPEGVAARIDVDSGLSSVEIDEDRFPKTGDVHQSANYDSAENRINLTISAGVSSIEVR